MDKSIEKKEMLFEKFYYSFVEDTLSWLDVKLEGCRNCISNQMTKSIKWYVMKCLQKISIRALIVEMHICKEKGMLGDGNVEEQYRVFCDQMVGNVEFMKYMKTKYPVMFECIADRVEMIVDYYVELICHFNKDISQIQKIAKNKSVRYIEDIRINDSDFHNQGKAVATIKLNSGEKIIYKPHSMENEKGYMNLLQWISKRIGIEQYQYAILSYETYSWCEMISYNSCMRQQELRRYYERLGVQLFLAYILGTKDLHSENLIAHGEYPVLIDLETLVNVSYDQKRETSFQEVCYQLSESVLYTGILPFYHFNKEGDGIDISGISGEKNQQYPIKVPMIINPYTSDMKVEYIYPKTKRAKNLALLKGEFIAPTKFVEDIIEGFKLGYLCILRRRKEFEKELLKIDHLQSRYLLQDTQRYNMLLLASYHPSLLADIEARKEILCHIAKGRRERDEIIEEEIQALWRGDIPYFSYSLKDKELICSNGNKIENYFETNPFKLIHEKMFKLSAGDMEKQCEFIRISMGLMPESIKGTRNDCYKMDETRMYIHKNKKYVQKVIDQLAAKIVNYAVWNDEHTEVNWFVLQLSSYGKSTWDIHPMNMYMYDGLSGMLLIMYELQKRDKQKFYEYYDTLRKMLWVYTDYMNENIDSEKIRNTGLYNGEGSILYAYCLLYRNGETEYIKYAKRHAVVLEKLLKYDQQFDLLNGNAGGAQALIYLYELTNDSTYLSYAEEAFSLLENRAIEIEEGIGWLVGNKCPPYTGLAHGNSGFLLPVASLLQHTGKEKYKILLQKILNYEELLYDEKLSNWRDVRGEMLKETIGSVAWCHGAGGILLSRVYCYERIEDENIREELKRDIIRAYQKLREYWRRDSWSLCHGSCGNVWIMKRTKKIVEKIVNQEKLPDVFYGQEEISLLTQERLNPGLMNGYGGILLYLLNLDK